MQIKQLIIKDANFKIVSVDKVGRLAQRSKVPVSIDHKINKKRIINNVNGFAFAQSYQMIFYYSGKKSNALELGN